MPMRGEGTRREDRRFSPQCLAFESFLCPHKTANLQEFMYMMWLGAPFSVSKGEASLGKNSWHKSVLECQQLALSLFHWLGSGKLACQVLLRGQFEGLCRGLESARKQPQSWSSSSERQEEECLSNAFWEPEWTVWNKSFRPDENLMTNFGSISYFKVVYCRLRKVMGYFIKSQS